MMGHTLTKGFVVSNVSRLLHDLNGALAKILLAQYVTKFFIASQIE